ncbi:MAG: peptidase domain-containing ABC transporter, partial [Prolixibacteraceae bacterium]|nr:peptidase domain-containing ABC transporter [Prolixibacteraceae bacterium]
MKIKIKQHDITDCGAACLASVAAYHKLYLPVIKIRQLAGTDRQGTNAWGLITAAGKIGLEAKGVKATPEALDKIPLPAIAHVIINDRLKHYVVLYKVKGKYLQIMDPASGQLRKADRQSFLNEWSGILILLSPSANFKKGNEKVSNLKRFTSLLLPHRKSILQALAGAGIFTLLGLSTSVYIQKITDYVLLNENVNLLNLLSVLMLVILLFQILTGSMQNVFILKTGQLIDAKLILGYYKHLLKLPQRFFDTIHTGEIISRINDAVKIRAFINDTLITFIVNIFIVFFAFTLMFIYNRKLAAAMLIIIPLHAITYLINNHLNKKRERIIMEQAADLESQLVESIDSIRTLKQLGLEYISGLKTETKFVNLLNSTYKSGLNSLFSQNSTFFINKLFTVILLWFGSILVLKREITPGELMSFYALTEYFTSPVEGLINMNKTFQNASIAADRLFEITDIKCEPDGDIVDSKEINTDNIIFRNVTFSYGMRCTVFENFNLTIENGKITAIIGESGSGKSTIAALLQKLYLPDEGAIYLGNTNLTYFRNEALRKVIGIVPQNNDLFTGTVTENIA